jgi:hypothetical protein
MREDILLGLQIEAEVGEGLPGGSYRLVEPEGDPAVSLARGTRPWCERRRLLLLLERHGRGNLNVAARTLGGKQWWADVMVHCGWRIQESVQGGRYRLLDPEDRRRAWGSWAACRVALEEQRLALNLRPRSSHGVVLVHGLIRSRDSMGALADALEEAGYEVINVNYPSTQRPIEEHAWQLSHLLDQLRELEVVSFVTHSMGGIIVRTLLSMEPGAMAWQERLSLGRVVMIFPPHQGAVRADRWRNSKLAQLVMGPALQELTPAAAQRLPRPRGHFAIIAGARDKTVRPNEALLPGAEYARVMDAEHTFGMRDPAIIAAALRYLNGGSLYDP